MTTITKEKIARLRGLYAQAPRWPATEETPGEHYWKCPTCGGDGAVDQELHGECLSSGSTIADVCVSSVQVYGVGADAVNLDQLIREALEALPALLDAADRELQAKL